MATQINNYDWFYSLVEATIKNHVCTQEEVIEVCSRWFITERRDMEELPEALGVYGIARDLGVPHNVAINRLCVTTATLDPRTLTMEDVAEVVYHHKKTKREKLHRVVIKDDIRMIRDD